MPPFRLPDEPCALRRPFPGEAGVFGDAGAGAAGAGGATNLGSSGLLLLHPMDAIERFCVGGTANIFAASQPASVMSQVACVSIPWLQIVTAHGEPKACAAKDTAKGYKSSPRAQGES